MEFNLATVLVFTTGLLAGIVGALGYIAPLTKTKIDDKIKEAAEKILVALKDRQP